MGDSNITGKLTEIPGAEVRCRSFQYTNAVARKGFQGFQVAEGPEGEEETEKQRVY